MICRESKVHFQSPGVKGMSVFVGLEVVQCGGESWVGCTVWRLEMGPESSTSRRLTAALGTWDLTSKVSGANEEL
jgi:hypothetical protein